jgi:WD40 repeat protein
MTLESAIARICQENGAIVGTGFLISEQYVLTCAHVVADALALNHDAVEMPQESVLLDFPYQQITGIKAKVIDWKPRSAAENQTGDDMALLQLETPVSNPQIYLIGTANITGHAYHAVGFPRGYDRSVSSYGIVRDRLPGGRWQLEGEGEGIAIQDGFSGCPVWDERAKGIIGMVVEEADAKVAFMIPADVLAQAFPRLQEWVIPYPFMAEDLPKDFVQRPREFEPLIEYLLTGNQPVAALKGAGGYGKTELARAICHDKGIRKAFRDGILWVTLGEKPNVLTALTKLYQTLTDTKETFVDKEQAAAELAQEWGDKHCLVVIDDVWNQAHLNPFLRGGDNCTRLVTTRNSDTLPSGSLKVDVDAMQINEAVQLLSYGLGESQKELLTQLQQLAQRLGEYPLLLKLANGVLRHRLEEAGQSLTDALAYINTALTRKGITAFDARDPEERYQAVKKTIEVSLELLDESERELYGRLAIFLDKVDIPSAALEKLWGLDNFDTEDFCDRLKRLSLLSDCNLNRHTIRLHDVIRHYLRRQANIPNLQQQFLNTYRHEIPPSLPYQGGNLKAPLKKGGWGDQTPWWQLPQDEPYLWHYLAYHLQEAGAIEEIVHLLGNFYWLQSKLIATNINALISDYDYLPPADSSLPNDSREESNLQSKIQNLQAKIQPALLLSSHVLRNDPKQLPSQLSGRLRHFNEAPIQAILQQIDTADFCFINCLSPSLTPPGGRLIRTLTGHSDMVKAVAITPDGKQVISSSWDNTLKVWNLVTGEEQFTLTGHSSSVYAVAVTPDGKQVISASSDNTLKVWNLVTGEEQFTLTGHSNSVRAVAVTPDGKQVISASSDNTLKVWNLVTGEEQFTLTGHSGRVNAVAVTPDGKQVISSSDDKTLKIWNLVTGEEQFTLTGHSSSVSAVAVTPDGKQVISASYDNTLKVWNLTTGKEQFTLTGHSHWINAVAVTPDGKQVISGSLDKTLKIWNLTTEKKLFTLTGHSKLVNAVAITPDSKWAISGSNDNTLKIWDLTTGKNLFTLTGHSQLVNTVVITPDGSRAISGSNDNTLKIWNLTTGKKLFTLTGHSDWVKTVAVTPDSKWAISGSNDHTLKIWDLTTGENLFTFTGHGQSVNTVVITPDGNRAISGSNDDTLKIWDLTTKKELFTLTGHNDWINAVAVTPDGKQAISVPYDDILKVWDLTTGKEQFTLTGHFRKVNAIVITPNGKWVISGSYKNTLKIWDLTTGKEQFTLIGHSNRVNAVAVTPDGKQVISGSWDNTLKIWDLTTGEIIATFTGDSSIQCCAVAPDGVTIVAGEFWGAVHFLRLQIP